MSRKGLTTLTFASFATVASLSLLLASPAASAPADRERAKKIHDRLVGVAPDETMLDLMELDIEGAGTPGLMAAANRAMTNPAFYRTSLKNWVTPWTNVDETNLAPLNDYSALVIGMVRDDVPFNEVLTADLAYTGVPNTYSQTDNQHYIDLENNRVDLSDPLLFQPTTQSSLPGSQLLANETAGVITTRAAGEAFFSAGTNRRMWRYTSKNFLCRDLEDMKDVTRPSDRIRQDLTRSPGGDSQIYHNDCTGCHSGMDGLAGAFAYFEWDMATERVVYTRGQVSAKHLINDNVFPGGYITVDDQWVNYWREGPNELLNWRGASDRGFGPKSLGAELAASEAFSICQVEKAFRHVCFRPPNDMTDVAQVQTVATEFEAEGYDLRNVFAKLAVYCTAP